MSANWKAVDRARQQSHPDARLHVRPDQSGRFDEANHRRETDFPGVFVNLAFIAMPPGHVPFADQREVPAADFPPGQIRVPDEAEIELTDVMVGKAAGHLYPELVGGGHAGQAEEHQCKGALERPAELCIFFVHQYPFAQIEG
jgi:hypothetical protein